VGASASIASLAHAARWVFVDQAAEPIVAADPIEQDDLGDY
jgi:hypothetical protein